MCKHHSDFTCTKPAHLIEGTTQQTNECMHLNYPKYMEQHIFGMPWLSLNPFIRFIRIIGLNCNKTHLCTASRPSHARTAPKHKACTPKHTCIHTTPFVCREERKHAWMNERWLLAQKLVSFSMKLTFSFLYTHTRAHSRQCKHANQKLYVYFVVVVERRHRREKNEKTK